MFKSGDFIYGVKETVSFRNASGKLRFNLTNDYLFRAVLQENKNVLKGLICSILDWKVEDILSVEVKNPIELGKSIEAKDFLLDVRVLLNDHTMINLEMQILNLGNWQERSLSYLCRSFDKLSCGQDYREVRPVVQVCFLDFTLFKEYPEFFSTYMFMNVKNHIVYSDKLKLIVIDLTKIEEANDEDRRRTIVHWARLFKATTWEEIKMLAKDNVYLEEAAETVYRLSEEKMIRLQCEAREDYYRQQRYIQKKLDRLEELEGIEQAIVEIEREKADLEQEKAGLEQEKAGLEQEKADLEQEKAGLEQEKAGLEQEKADLEREKAGLEQEKADLEQEKADLEQKNAELERNHEMLKERNGQKDERLAAQAAEITRLKAMLEALCQK